MESLFHLHFSLHSGVHLQRLEHALGSLALVIGVAAKGESRPVQECVNITDGVDCAFERPLDRSVIPASVKHVPFCEALAWLGAPGVLLHPLCCR